MKKLSLLLALVMLLGCACAEPALLRTAEYAQLIDGTNLLRIEGNRGYAIADLQGNMLTDYDYSYSLYYDNGLITANLYNAENLSGNGALKLDGSVAVPFKYADVDVLGSQWAVGITLTKATRDNFDYESWSDDSVYLIDYVDIYSLATGEMLTLPRANYDDSKAYGSTINIEDRSTGNVTVYDASFNVIGTVDNVYDEDFARDYVTSFYDDGQYGLKSGDTIIMEPSCDYIYSFNGGYTRFEEDDLYGVIDMQGNIVIPAEYDDIETSYYLSGSSSSGYCAGGYFCVVKNGKMGYATEAGITCEPKYSVDIMENNGASATFTDMEGNFNIMAADGVITPITGYDSVRCAYYGNGFYYVVTDEDYNHGLIDWHGNVVFPCAYGDIEISGDGQYALVEVEYGVSEIYSLNTAVAAETPAAESSAVEAPADKTEASNASSLMSFLQASVKGSGAETPAAEAPVAEVPAEQAPAVEAPVEQAPAADNPVKLLLENAKLLVSVDAASAATLIDSAIVLLGDSNAAIVLSSAKTLITADAAANSAAIITLIDNAIAML